MILEKASKLKVVNDILTEIEHTPLDDTVSLRRFLFQIGTLSEVPSQNIYERTVRAAIKAKLGDRESAKSDAEIAYLHRKQVHPGLQVNICRVMLMLGCFRESSSIINELLDNGGLGEDIQIVSTLVSAAMLMGEVHTIKKFADSESKLAKTLAGRILGFLDTDEKQKSFSYRQKLITNSVQEKICDYVSVFAPDNEGFWRIRTEYWLNLDYSECDEITDCIWMRSDEFQRKIGFQGDYLTPVAPFLIKELPAFNGS